MSIPDPDFIDHYREAETTLDAVMFTHGSEQVHSYTEYALAEATLAVAYEQRTANLIAAFGLTVDTEDCPTFIGERVEPLDIANQIMERLGLS